MATAQLLPVAAGAANSADFTLASYTQATICLKGSDGNDVDPKGQIILQAKTDDGKYVDIGEIGADSIYGEKVFVLNAPGTWRVRRTPNGVAVGAFYST